MTIEQTMQDLYEALEELRQQAAETLRLLDGSTGMSHPADAVDDVLEGELGAKLKLVATCAEDLKLAIDEREVSRQNRADGYGSAE